jgi:hypothetical protein
VKPLDTEQMSASLAAAIRSNFPPEDIVRNLRTAGESMAVKIIAMLPPESFLEKLDETDAGRKLRADYRDEFLRDYFTRMVNEARKPAS